MDDPNYLEGLEIADKRSSHISDFETGGLYEVPRSVRSEKSRVTVKFGRETKHCTCRDFREDRWCGHVYAVEIYRDRKHGLPEDADRERLGRDILEWKEPKPRTDITWGVAERPRTTWKNEIVIYSGSGERFCECADYRGDEKEEWCPHIWAVHLMLERERRRTAERTSLFFDPFAERFIPKPQGGSKWAPYNLSRRHGARDFRRLLHGLCRHLTDRPSERGRPRYPLSDVVFATALKVFEKKDNRGAEAVIEAAKDAGWISTAPKRSKIEGFLRDPETTYLLTSLIATAARPLLALDTHFACDSSGFAVSRRFRWNDDETREDREGSDWLMVQLICGVQTYAVAAAKVVGRHARDQTHLIDMVERAQEQFVVDTVAADKGYLSRANYTGVSNLGVKLFTPFKSNSKANGDEHWGRAYHLFHVHPEKFAEVYNKRQSAESAFWMIKSKFDEKIESKKSPAPENELLMKVLCHNVCCVLSGLYQTGLYKELHL